MAAVNEGVLGQRDERIERGLHLLRGAFEQAAAAGAEERVAAEERAVTRIGNVSRGVSRYVEHANSSPSSGMRATSPCASALTVTGMRSRAGPKTRAPVSATSRATPPT
jgi:hypothetical protein